MNEQHPQKNPSEKKTLLGLIFGTKKDKSNNDPKLKTTEEEQSKKEFLEEIKEISDEENKDAEQNERIVIEDESVRFLNTDKEKDNYSNDKHNQGENTESEVNDDLLQIPAFLRRQAN